MHHLIDVHSPSCLLTRRSLATLSPSCACRIFAVLARTDSTDSPDCLPILLNISVFIFSFFFFHFLVLGSMRSIKPTFVGLQAHVKLVYRIVRVAVRSLANQFGFWLQASPSFRDGVCLIHKHHKCIANYPCGSRASLPGLLRRRQLRRRCLSTNSSSNLYYCPTSPSSTFLFSCSHVVTPFYLF